MRMSLDAEIVAICEMCVASCDAFVQRFLDPRLQMKCSSNNNNGNDTIHVFQSTTATVLCFSSVVP
jgi:hypothetical protein